MSRRVLGLIAAIALAAVGTVAIVAYVRGAEDRALEGQDVVKVLVVTDEVPAGTPAEDLGDRVRLERITKKVQADGAVTSITAIEGKVASATLVPGEQVVERRFIDASAYRARGTAVDIPDGLLSTTIAIDPERAVGGVLTPGSLVAVTASFDSVDLTQEAAAGGAIDPAAAGTSEPVTHINHRKVLVTNVQTVVVDDEGDSIGPDGDGNSDDEPSSEIEPGDAPENQFLVTLALDDVSSEKLIFAAEHGTVWLSLEPSDAPEGATKVVTHGNVFE